MVAKTVFKSIKYGLSFLIAVLLFNWSCTQEASTSQQVLTSLSKEIKEISPGILKGYLPEDKIPNSLKLIPPPPKEGSVAFLLDQEIASSFVSLKDEKRKEQAVKDAELAFPQATETFNIILALASESRNFKKPSESRIFEFDKKLFKYGTLQAKQK